MRAISRTNTVAAEYLPAVHKPQPVRLFLAVSLLSVCFFIDAYLNFITLRCAALGFLLFISSLLRGPLWLEEAVPVSRRNSGANLLMIVALLFVLYSSVLFGVAEKPYYCAVEMLMLYGSYLLFLLTVNEIRSEAELLVFVRWATHLAVALAFIYTAWMVVDPKASAKPDFFIDIELIYYMIPLTAAYWLSLRASASRIWYGGIVGILCLTPLLTSWRGGLASMIFMLVLMVLLYGKGLRVGMVTALAICLALFLMSVMEISVEKTPIAEKIQRKIQGHDVSSTRVNLWVAAWRIFNKHPLTGVGPGNFPVHYVGEADKVVRYELLGRQYKSYRYHHPEGRMRVSIHNLFFVLLAEYGLIGLCLFLLLIFLALKSCRDAVIRFQMKDDQLMVRITYGVVVSTFGLLLLGMVSGAGGKPNMPFLWLFLAMAAVIRRLALEGARSAWPLGQREGLFYQVNAK